jgi:hypothetical protein
MANKAQKLTNELANRYGLNTADLTDSELTEVIEALNALKGLDRDELVNPDDFDGELDDFDDEDELEEEFAFGDDEEE